MNHDNTAPASILATDCGSTTTKAILIEKRDGRWRLAVRGEAPTTVEAPVEDVTRGVINAISEVQELAGRQILDGDTIIKPLAAGKGVDRYLSTSSAGGGLQMVVVGLVLQMTAESAQRAALGAGAIVMDSLALNDGRGQHQRLERIRKLRPDMILFAGGTDGGNVEKVLETAEMLAAADPAPRLGLGYRLPVVYAGNAALHDDIRRILGDRFSLDITDNLRPVLERENLEPARGKIQALFLEHVMAHAPGYGKLIAMADEEIMPTPAAVGRLMQQVAKEDGINVLGVDIGGATTDVFSVFGGTFTRTVSANYGMSYSISQVMVDAGIENIEQWLPHAMSTGDVRNRIKNKMIRPTTIPYLPEDLILEQALCREALRLSFDQHRSLARGLVGVQQERTIGEAFDQRATGVTLVDLQSLDLILGSGGVLSHAPRRIQAALMMIDGFLPEGITMLAVDSIFMMPQLGVIARTFPEAASEVFRNDCYIPLGPCAAPVGVLREGALAVEGAVIPEKGSTIEFSVRQGEMVRIPLARGEKAALRARPSRCLDLGDGKGAPIEKEIQGGEAGVIIDCRGRPLVIPRDRSARIEKLNAWYGALGVYNSKSEPLPDLQWRAKHGRERGA
jgi:uncharacterized protein (TIGR01319 family)